MRERLQRAWAERVHRARQWQRGDDPTPVLEALGHAVVWHLLDELDRIDGDDRRTVSEAAGPAIAAARERALADQDARDGWLDSVALADLGHALLEGEEPGDLGERPGDLRRPTPRRLASMLDGQLDGLSSAACAVWCLRNDPSEARLLWALNGAGTEGARRDSEPILVAAADAEPMRPPDEGELVATHEQAGVEAVWFARERQLALYAAESTYVSLAAPGVTVHDLRSGYWVGTVDADAPSTLDAELEVGEQTWRWKIPLG